MNDIGCCAGTLCSFRRHPLCSCAYSMAGYLTDAQLEYISFEARRWCVREPLSFRRTQESVPLHTTWVIEIERYHLVTAAIVGTSEYLTVAIVAAPTPFTVTKHIPPGRLAHLVSCPSLLRNHYNSAPGRKCLQK
jgi:hypothetical protein